VNQHPLSRTTVIVINVVLLHASALWALQSGLLRKAVEITVPAQMLSEFIKPLAPKVVPPPPAPPPVAQPQVKPKTVTPPPAPQPQAIADPTPSLHAPVGVAEPRPPLPPITAPVTVAAAPPEPPAAPPASPKVELPSSDADYLQNPRPVYPPLSKRLGEQGQAIHSILIGPDGLPTRAKLVKSSGFDRLDQAAYQAVMSWRYVPGKRNGVAVAMSYNAPISFVLE
jgi:periplasmic protein TonB